MTEAQLRVLSVQDDLTLAHWNLILNRWGWPEELPDKETVDEYRAQLKDSGGPGAHRTVRSEIMAWIEHRVGKRFILRLHNADMTGSEFEDFWQGCYRGDAAARQRYESRVGKRLNLKEET